PARPLGGLAGKGDLVPVKARLIADHSARATLALEAVAHGDAHRLTLDCEVQLAATAGGIPGGHGYQLQESRVPRTIAANVSRATDCIPRTRTSWHSYAKVAAKR